MSSGSRKEPPDSGWKGKVPSHDGGDGEQDYMNMPPYGWQSDRFRVDYTMTCWCGRLAFEIMGEPVTAKCCHCRDCQKLHGAPFQHAVLFFKVGVRLKTNDQDALSFFTTEQNNGTHYVPCKVGCGHCHSPLFDEGRTMVLAYPSGFDFAGVKAVPAAFKPKDHIFYASRIFDVNDGVPKWTKHVGSERMDET